MNEVKGHFLDSTQLLFDAALTSRVDTEPYKGLMRFGPFNNSRVRLGKHSLLFVFPRSEVGLARELWKYIFRGDGRFAGFEQMFRVEIPDDAVTDFGFDADLSSLSTAATAYRNAVRELASQRRASSVALAFVVVPRSERWELETPYYAAKSELASMGIPSQMVTTDLIEDTSRFNWAAANIALASFAKLGGIPWTVVAPSDESDLVLGVGRQDVGPKGDRRRTFGYAVTFVSNGLYRQTWSMAPVADKREYVRRLSDAVEGALSHGVADLDQPPARVIVHLSKKARREEIEAVREAMSEIGMELPVAFVRLDDSSLWDVADDREDHYGPQRGLAVRLDETRGLLQTESVTGKGAPRGPLLLQLDSRSSVRPEGFDELVAQSFRLAHANWRTFTGQNKPATLLYGEQLANLVGHMSRLSSWNPHVLPPELRSVPWFL